MSCTHDRDGWLSPIPLGELVNGEQSYWEVGMAIVVGLTDNNMIGGDPDLFPLMREQDVSLRNPPNYLGVYDSDRGWFVKVYDLDDVEISAMDRSIDLYIDDINGAL